MRGGGGGMLVRFTNTDSLGPSGRWATHTRRIVTTTNSNEALNASQYSVFPEPMQNGTRRVRIWVDFRYFAFRSSESVKWQAEWFCIIASPSLTSTMTLREDLVCFTNDLNLGRTRRVQIAGPTTTENSFDVQIEETTGSSLVIRILRQHAGPVSRPPFIYEIFISFAGEHPTAKTAIFTKTSKCR